MTRERKWFAGVIPLIIWAWAACVIVGPICPLIDLAFNAEREPMVAHSQDKLRYLNKVKKTTIESHSPQGVSQPSVISKIIGTIAVAPVIIGIWLIAATGLVIMYAIVAAISFGVPILLASVGTIVASSVFPALKRWYIWAGMGLIVAYAYPFIAPIDVIKICSSNRLTAQIGLEISGVVAGLVMYHGLGFTWRNDRAN